VAEVSLDRLFKRIRCLGSRVCPLRRGDRAAAISVTATGGMNYRSSGFGVKEVLTMMNAFSEATGARRGRGRERDEETQQRKEQ